MPPEMSDDDVLADLEEFAGMARRRITELKRLTEKEATDVS